MNREVCQFKKIFIWLFGIYTLLGMHYFQLNQGGSGLHIPINAMGWALISVLIAVGLWKMADNQQLIYNNVTLVLFFAAILLTLPLFWANTVTAPLSYARLLGLWGGVLYFITLQQFNFNEKDKRLLLYLILVAVMIEGVMSCGQYFFSQWLKFLHFNQENRPFGIFQQSNVAASFFVTGVALSLFLLINENNKFRQIFSVLCCFIATFSCLLIQSRLSYVGLILVLTLILPWAISIAVTCKPKRKVLAIWLVVFITAIAASKLAQTTTEDRMRSQQELTEVGPRGVIFQHSLQMFLQKPLLGWGYGSFEVNFLTSYADALVKKQAILGADENLHHPHNELLFWVVEGGVTPLLGLLLLAFGFLYYFYRNYHCLLMLALTGLLSPILLHTQIEFPFYQSVTHWFIFLTLVWFIFSVLPDKKINLKYKSLPKFFAILLPIICIPYMFTTLHTIYLMYKYHESDPRELSYLSKVINPVSFHTRFNYSVNLFRLRTAMIQGDEAELTRYISWARTVTQHTPRASVYRNWIACLWLLEHKNEAIYLLSKAKKLYPVSSEIQSIKLDALLENRALSRLTL